MYLWWIGWKPKAYTSCVPYLKEDRFIFIVCKYVLSNKPCLHAKLQKHNRSYWKVKTVIWLFSWGWGHLNSFSARWGVNLNKNFPKIQMPGGVARGGGNHGWSFDLTGTLPYGEILIIWVWPSTSPWRILKFRFAFIRIPPDIFNIKMLTLPYHYYFHSFGRFRQNWFKVHNMFTNRIGAEYCLHSLGFLQVYLI